ncbi:recombinase family protein [Nocardia rhizosphaerae]|uniref:Recombinase family protein n=1 Tax=Nocardia rhizosphaerae TaxID=1691571 RepID=A0ABV8L3M0_9NOCA
MATRENVDAPSDWVLYFRKSGPGDKSIEDQERVGRRDIASIGGTVVATFSDNLSASRYRRVQDRPGFQQARKAIQAGKARGLWTFAANRAHRDLDDYVDLRRLCIETGSLWRYGGRTYDLSQTADRRTANADALRAEEYSDDLADAINRGVSLALEDGKPHGRLPRGYRIIRDELTGKPIERRAIPEQAAVIRWAAEQALAGASMHALSKEFGERWATAGGKPFKHGVVDQRLLRRMLINPTYAGLRTHRGEVRRIGTWESILDVGIHQQLVALLTDPKRKLHRGTTPRYLCTHIAECGVCGDGVGARRPTSRVGKPCPPVYRCRLGHVSRRMERVDEHVEELLMQMLETTSVSSMLGETEDGAKVIDRELALIEELRKESTEYVREAARTRMRAELVAVYVDGLDDQIREAEERIAAITGSYASDLLLELAKDPRRKWQDYDLLQRREVLRQTVRIVVMPAPRGGFGQEGPLHVDVFPAGALHRGEGAVSSKGKRWPTWYAEQSGGRDAD